LCQGYSFLGELKLCILCINKVKMEVSVENKNLNKGLLPKLIAASAGLTVQEFFKLGGLKGFVLFLLVFVVVGLVAEVVLYVDEEIPKKRKLIGVVIFVFLTAVYVYLKSKHRVFI